MTQKYFDEAPKPNAKQLAELERMKAEAKRQRQSAEDSFQRSDTDGFLSQWASQIGAELNDAKAKLLENGGCATFNVLMHGDRVVADKVYTFADRFAPDHWNNPVVRKWKLPPDLASQLGRTWVPYGDTSKVQKQLGLRQVLKWFPAEAKITTGGRKSTGLSGCANAFVAVFKLGTEEWD